MQSPCHETKASIPCRCGAEKLSVIHRYLGEQFPEYALRDFHAPTRLLEAGLPSPQGAHHVISLKRRDVLPYYAVLLNDFFECSIQEISNYLRRWEVGDVLRADRIAVVSAHGASSL